MMGIRSVDYFLAAAGLLGHGVLLLLLVRRHLLGRLPAFTLLIAFYLLRSALLLLPHFSAARPEIYWLLIYLDPGLQLLVMMSFCATVWRREKLVLLAIPVWLLLAALLAWLVGPSSHYSPQNLAIKLSILVSALWLQMAAILFLLLRKSGPESRLPLSIAYGFAAYSAINIVTELVHMHYALLRQHAFYLGLSYLRVAVYLCCLAAWSVLVYRETKTTGR